MKKNDQKTEIKQWHNIVMWRGLAESAARLLTKGILVYLEGKLHTRSFTDAAGIKRYTTEVIAESFKPLGRKSDFEDRDQE